MLHMAQSIPCILGLVSGYKNALLASMACLSLSTLLLAYVCVVLASPRQLHAHLKVRIWAGTETGIKQGNKEITHLQAIFCCLCCRWRLLPGGQ
jgi:Mn2+/Fe2+ NRAMP family transporter